MANVMEILGRIKTAIYGRDVRQSIYDAILQCYNDATGNPESIAAHTGDTDNPHNVTADQVGLAPVDGVTLSILDGYIKSIVTASGLKTKDTNGLIGEENAEVMLQALIDDITNRVVNQILTKTMLVNNALTTVSGQYPADAAYLKTLKDLIDNLTTAVSKLNSDLSNIDSDITSVNNKFSDFSFEKSENLDSFNENLIVGKYRILYGLINSTAYVSIDVNWIRIQFKSSASSLYYRVIYGSNPATDWSVL